MYPISVLLSVYNAEKLISFTIESILEQTFKDFELVIVNDGSKDKTLNVLKHYADKDSRIRIINKTNSGLIDSLNIGLAECTSEIIVRHDAEDISHKQRFEISYRLMMEKPDISCISTSSFFLNEEYKVVGISPLMPLKDLNKALDNNQSKIVHGNVIYRKSDVLKAGGYPHVMHAEDHGLWKLMRQKGMNFFMYQKPLYGYIKMPWGVSYKNMATQIDAVAKAGGIYISDEEIKKKVIRNQLRNQCLFGFPDEVKSIPRGLSTYYYFWFSYFRMLSLYQKFILQKNRQYLKGFSALKYSHHK